ncbi:glutathione reductase [Eremomyces bilateralis CBS 781.70]|uniref:Glutathione reductase n=1 Tax=Eremomyces bilateralis CBS 781.70 TaxID=1392243 RepID=A0A6G1G3A5_9PEZI|nr:glutathione reductase [Eremomyces bilateralis CBS 781.70]KAF1812411.1 glutathione reductase [Eremomyces bilateralis CBS 781.70]
MAPAKAYDYIVIGGGSGGSGTARRASGWYGAKTLIILDGPSGGCCVNVGCVPKKITWNFASISEMLRDGVHYGYDIPAHVPYDFAAFKKKRDAAVARNSAAYDRNWTKEGIEVVHGTASFVDSRELEVELQDGSGKARFSAPHICIATGSYPILPTNVEGAHHGLTSDGFFDIEVLPKKMAIVGAGYIAVEIAGMLNAVGVEVHMFIRGSTFLRKFDPMIQQTLTKRYEDAGVIIHKNFGGFAKVERLDNCPSSGTPHERRCEGPSPDKKLKLIANSGEDFEVGELLWAVGRGPETKSLDLETIGVQVAKHGHIIVDEWQNTNVNGVYALGDVTGQMELTPVAIAAGRQLGNRLFGPPHLKESKLEYQNIPSVVFAHPEVGTIGLTEPEARERFGADQIKVYHTKFSAMFYDVFPAEEKADKPTEYKLVCAGPEEKVVGLHILGLNSGEMLQGFGVALKMGATKKDFDRCVAIHPTSAEEIVTIK